MRAYVFVFVAHHNFSIVDKNSFQKAVNQFNIFNSTGKTLIMDQETEK